MKEEWRDVIGYEGLYQVSNLGRVRSLDRVVPHKGSIPRNLKGKLLKISTGKAGYNLVRFTKRGKGLTFRLCRVVAKTFIGECPEGKEVCHGLEGKQCDSVNNLRYDTHSNNALDRYEEGTMKNKPVRRSDGREYRSAQEASRLTGATSAEIGKVCRKYKSPSGKRNLTAGGYSWEFI